MAFFRLLRWRICVRVGRLRGSCFPLAFLFQGVEVIDHALRLRVQMLAKQLAKFGA